MPTKNTRGNSVRTSNRLANSSIMTHWLTFLEWRSSQRPLLREEDATRNVIQHLTHIEDLVTTNGVDGAIQAVALVRALTNGFSGHANAPVNLSVKIDGAPALVAGTDPDDGKFFVGTKGAFAKTPQIAKSTGDINRLYGNKPGLRDKMLVAFDALSQITFPNIMQGDLLFTPDLKVPQTIDGVKFITFTPNTITYGIPVDSKLGQDINRAKFGICFHTVYTGGSFAQLQARPAVKSDIEPLRTTSEVIVFSSEYQDLSGTLTLTDRETTAMNTILTRIQPLTTKLRTNTFLTALTQLPLLKTEFSIFQNTLVRGGESITLSPATFIERFETFLQQRGEKDAEKKTTQAGQNSTRTRYAKLIAVVRDIEDGLTDVLAWQNGIIAAKTLLLQKLNASSNGLRTFIHDDEGLIAGPHEGFVAVDAEGRFVKLVDRSYFSRLNFLSTKFKQ